ncbi:MAG TPA: hypothetical protein VGI81_12190 [Tepidisphaeraceae bacterium]|jgi:hypothetical protein
MVIRVIISGDMSRVVFLTAIPCVLFGSIAMAGAVDASARESDPVQVERFAAKLSAEQWRERRDAVAWLIHAGPSAELPLRRLVDQTRNPEARTRAERVLKRIDQIRRVEPASITLDLDHASVAAAFERLADIEGEELPTDPPDVLAHCDGTVTASYHGQTYWQAVLDLCRQTGLELRFEDRGVVLSRKGENSAGSTDALSCSGVFLVRARLTRWSHEPREPGRSVRIELYAEPRAELVEGLWRATLAEATDQHGQSLRPLAESGINMGGSERLANGYAWSVPLRPVASADTRLARLRGQVDVVLAEQVVSGQAPDHAGDRTLAGPMPIHLPCGSVSASVLRVVKADASWNMEMQVDTDPAEIDWEAVMQALGSGGLRAFDADGRELVLQNFWRAGGGPSNMVRCKWGGPHDPTKPQPGDPFKLVWRIPGKTVRAAVPFELKDVMLAD